MNSKVNVGLADAHSGRGARVPEHIESKIIFHSPKRWKFPRLLSVNPPTNPTTPPQWKQPVHVPSVKKVRSVICDRWQVGSIVKHSLFYGSGRSIIEKIGIRASNGTPRRLCHRREQLGPNFTAHNSTAKYATALVPIVWRITIRLCSCGSESRPSDLSILNPRHAPERRSLCAVRESLRLKSFDNWLILNMSVLAVSQKGTYATYNEEAWDVAATSSSSQGAWFCLQVFPQKRVHMPNLSKTCNYSQKFYRHHQGHARSKQRLRSSSRQRGDLRWVEDCSKTKPFEKHDRKSKAMQSWQEFQNEDVLET